MDDMPEPVILLQLTERQVAMIFATADIEARGCVNFARATRAIPAVSRMMAEEGAEYVKIREACRSACPGLADAEIEGPPMTHRGSRA